MRKKVIAGNWKMNTDLNEAVQLIVDVKNAVSGEDVNCDIIVCPPHTFLLKAWDILEESKIMIGAQNMYYEDTGAFTGEIGPDMLKSIGTKYVILGHSERRTIFGEDDAAINKKIKKAIVKGLKPIFCIGETLQERETGVTRKVVESQVREGLKDVSAEGMKDVIIAYEPVWAIGTGKTATPEQAQEVHAFLRELIGNMYDADTAENLTIQYGGSMKPDNAKELLSQKDIDGGLIGGASLKTDAFFEIIKSA